MSLVLQFHREGSIALHASTSCIIVSLLQDAALDVEKEQKEVRKELTPMGPS